MSPLKTLSPRLLKSTPSPVRKRRRQLVIDGFHLRRDCSRLHADNCSLDRERRALIAQTDRLRYELGRAHARAEQAERVRGRTALRVCARVHPT